MGEPSGDNRPGDSAPGTADGEHPCGAHGDEATERDRAHDLVREYLVEAHDERMQNRAALEALRDRPRAVRWHWVGAAGVLVLAAGIGAVLLMRPEDDATRATKAAAHARCVARQAEVMRAVVQYRRDRGSSPPDLGVLRPHYLNVDPVDPETGQAYVYARHGDIASVSCPLHRGEPLAGAPNGMPPFPQRSYAVTPR